MLRHPLFLFLAACFLFPVFQGDGDAQSLTALLSGKAQAPGFKSYSSYEDYCRDNPHAPTCKDGKPLDLAHYDWSKTLDLNPMAAYCRKNPHSPGCDLPGSQAVKPAAPPTSTRLRMAALPALTAPSGPRELPSIKGLNLTPSWRFAHSNPDALIGINISSLKQSATVHAVLEKLAAKFNFKAAGLPPEAAQLAQVEQCWVSLQRDDFLVLVQGHLPMASGFVEMQNGLAFYRISDNAVIIGKRASVSASVQRLLHPSEQQPAILRQAAALAANNDIWLAGSKPVLDQALAHAQLAQPQIAAFVNSLNHYTVSLRLQDQLEFGMKLQFNSAATAQAVFAAMHNNPSLPSNPDVKVSSEVDGSAVLLNVVVPPNRLLDYLDKGLNSPYATQMASLAGKSMASDGTITVSGMPGGPRKVKGQRIDPGTNGKVVIYGLAEGKKEVAMR